MNLPKQCRTKGPRIAAVPVALILLLAVAPPAIPQSLGLGARVGLSLARLAGGADTDEQTGFVAGAYLTADITDRFALYPELAFVRKGGSWKTVGQSVDPESGNPVEWTLTETAVVDYVQVVIPGVVMIPLSGSGATFSRFYVGPFYGLQVSCDFTQEFESTEVSTSGTSTANAESQDCSAWLKNYDYGLVFGGGIDVGVGKGALTGDVRYELGLPDIAGGEASLETRALLFLVGYSYPLGDG
jgi:hypothetical protein